jgi:hypothetical protein
MQQAKEKVASMMTGGRQTQHGFRGLSPGQQNGGRAAVPPNHPHAVAVFQLCLSVNTGEVGKLHVPGTGRSMGQWLGSVRTFFSLCHHLSWGGTAMRPVCLQKANHHLASLPQLRVPIADTPRPQSASYTCPLETSPFILPSTYKFKRPPSSFSLSSFLSSTSPKKQSSISILISR